MVSKLEKPTRKVWYQVQKFLQTGEPKQIQQLYTKKKKKKKNIYYFTIAIFEKLIFYYNLFYIIYFLIKYVNNNAMGPRWALLAMIHLS